MQYWGQKDSKYADCLPVAFANACRFYGIPCIEPGTERWEEVIDFSGCRHGAAIKSVEELAEFFGLQATQIPVNKAVGQLPIVLTVCNPDAGTSLHSVLIVGWNGNIATTINYRHASGPIVERLPLRFGTRPPERTDGSLNRDIEWQALYVPGPPNDRCYLLEPR